MEENFEEYLFLIYQSLNSNPTSPITIFITTADHTLSIEIDTEASISLLNWETFQKVFRQIFLYCRLTSN